MGALQDKIQEIVNAKGAIGSKALAQIMEISEAKLINRTGSLVRAGLLAMNGNNEYIPGPNKDRTPSIQCLQCSRKFLTKSSLAGHIKWTHEGKPPIRKGKKASEENDKKEGQVADLTVKPQAKAEQGSEPITPDKLEDQLPDEPPPPIIRKNKTMTEMGITEYDVFVNRGLMVGFPKALVELTAEVVFNGEYKDLDFVWRAMGEMNLRGDMKERWFHSWRAYLGKGMPPSVARATSYSHQDDPESAAVAAEASRDKKRSFVLSADNVPQFVGDGLGDLTYEDALDLAKIRNSRANIAGAAGAAAKPESMADLLRLFKEMMGGNGNGQKGMVLIPTPDGGFAIKEVAPGEMVIPPQPKALAAPPAPVTWYLDPATQEMKQVPAGAPMVIRPPSAPAAAPARTFIVGQDGNLQEADPSRPMIIRIESPAPPQAPQGQQPPIIQLNGPDGQPMRLDLASLMQYNKFQNEEKRAQESHQQKQEVVGVVKDFLSKLGSAAGHLGDK